MITRYLTEVTAKFNPFSKRAKAARLFISLLPAEARSNVNLKTTLLPRTSTAAPVLDVKFKDGKEIKLNLKDMKINEIVDQVDRHSRMLAREEDLTG